MIPIAFQISCAFAAIAITSISVGYTNWPAYEESLQLLLSEGMDTLFCQSQQDGIVGNFVMSSLV